MEKGLRQSFKPKHGNSLPTLKNGEKSKILDKLSSFCTCPVREYCDLFLQKSELEKLYGCQDTRQIHLTNLKRYKKPASELINLAAEVETKLQYQTIIDGVRLENLSHNSKYLLELKLRILDMIYKYEKGTKQTINVIHDNFDLQVNKEAYKQFDKKIISAEVKKSENEEKDGIHSSDRTNTEGN